MFAALAIFLLIGGITITLKQWGIVLGASILGNTYALVAALIVSAIVFISGFLFLSNFGLVSAVIYTVAAMGFVWLVGTINKSALKKYWWISFIVPFAFVFGFVGDHLSVMSIAHNISSNVALYQNAWSGSQMIIVYGATFVATLFLVLAVVILVVKSRKKIEKLF